MLSPRLPAAARLAYGCPMPWRLLRDMRMSGSRVSRAASRKFRWKASRCRVIECLWRAIRRKGNWAICLARWRLLWSAPFAGMKITATSRGRVSKAGRACAGRIGIQIEEYSSHSRSKMNSPRGVAMRGLSSAWSKVRSPCYEARVGAAEVHVLLTGVGCRTRRRRDSSRFRGESLDVVHIFRVRRCSAAAIYGGERFWRPAGYLTNGSTRVSRRRAIASLLRSSLRAGAAPVEAFYTADTMCLTAEEKRLLSASGGRG